MNIREMSLTALTKLRREVLAAIKAKRPKASKPKQRKVRTTEERERERAYVAFLRDRCDRCWICGRTANDKPDWWHGVFMIERMHIVNKPRREDIRAIIAGCSLCHRIEHGDRFPQTDREPVGMAFLLALKLAHDPDNYDPEFLQKHSVRRLEFPT